MKFERKQKYNKNYNEDDNNKCEFTCPRVTKKWLAELTDSNLF